MLRFQQSDFTSQDGLSIFKNPIVPLGCEKRQWVEYRPSNPLTGDSPIQFTISGSGNQYIDLKHSILAVKAKILNSEGEDFEGDVWLKTTEGGVTTTTFNDNHNAGPVNLWLHSLFNQVDLSFQQQSTDVATMYAYRSYLETLCYPYDKHLGETELFYKDVANHMNSTTIVPANNIALADRATRTMGNTECDMEGTLRLDLFQQERYLLNKIDISLKFWHSKDSFRIMSNVGDCTVKITDAVLKMCKIDLNDRVFEHHENIIAHHNALYPYLKTEMKAVDVQKGRYALKLDDIFQNRVPAHLMFGFVETKSYNGDVTKNPYDFQHCNLSEIGVYVNNNPVPHRPFTTNFSSPVVNSSGPFRAMFEGNPELDLSHVEYDHGYTLFKYFLTDVNTSHEGNCSIQLKFAETLQKDMTMIIMAKFPAMMTISKDRQITIS